VINPIAAVEEEASSAERDPLNPSDVMKNSLPSRLCVSPTSCLINKETEGGGASGHTVSRSL